MHSLISAPSLVSAVLLGSSVVNAGFHLDFKRRPHAKQLARRDGETVSVPGTQQLGYTPEGGYFANITIGTPPQPLEIQLDTGSSETFIQATTACEGRDSDNPCVGGVFNTSASSSYRVTAPGALIQAYGTGSQNATGDYALDTVTLGDAVLPGTSLAVATKSNINDAVMGLGTDALLGGSSNITKATILDSLKTNGAISSKIFSIWLDPDYTQGGSFYFGGVDDSKYDINQGLVTLDQIRNPFSGLLDYYLVPLLEMSISGNGESDPFLPPADNTTSPNFAPALPVHVDSGNSGGDIPESVFNLIVSLTGAKQVPSFPGGYGVPCSYAQNQSLQDVKLSWTLGDPRDTSKHIQFSVPLSSLIIPIYHQGTANPYTVTAGDVASILGEPAPANPSEEVQVCGVAVNPVDPSPGNFVTLGDVFMRAMFSVFDPEHNRVSFGKPLARQVSWTGIGGSGAVGANGTATGTSNSSTTGTGGPPAATFAGAGVMGAVPGSFWTSTLVTVAVVGFANMLSC
ncbi:MAG: hypothetical protein M1820_006284 [Bogoriella megaspora]|nr:MAG: hypothetical protein M1820_006284 [Bogoriella megaspora]